MNAGLVLALMLAGSLILASVFSYWAFGGELPVRRGPDLPTVTAITSAHDGTDYYQVTCGNVSLMLQNSCGRVG